MKRLIYIFLFLPLLLNGQQLIEKKTYPFKGYAFQCDGASNYILATNTNLPTDTGILSITFKSSLTTIQTPFNTWDGTINNFTLIYLGNSTSTYPNESITILIKNTSSYVFSMFLRKGETYYLDGKEHSVQIIVDGINDRFIVDDTIYDEASGYVSFYYGAKTSKYLIQGNKIQIGKRLSSNDLYLDGTIKNIYITNLHDTLAYYPLSESGGSVAYSVSGGGNGTIYGSDYWTTSTNSYNKTYGVTKVKYNGQSVFVPYTINKTPIYNHSIPVMNSNEKYINYPDTIWNKKYWVK